jgi:hypothetical protein
MLIEITLWVSIAFHSILGSTTPRPARATYGRYAYQDNLRYTLAAPQRLHRDPVHLLPRRDPALGLDLPRPRRHQVEPPLQRLDPRRRAQGLRRVDRRRRRVSLSTSWASRCSSSTSPTGCGPRRSPGGSRSASGPRSAGASRVQARRRPDARRLGQRSVRRRPDRPRPGPPGRARICRSPSQATNAIISERTSRANPTPLRSRPAREARRPQLPRCTSTDESASRTTARVTESEHGSIRFRSPKGEHMARNTTRHRRRGGLAGSPRRVRIAESGVAVDLFRMVPVKRSHSVCAQGRHQRVQRGRPPAGLLRVPALRRDDLRRRLPRRPGPVLEMANWAPKIIDLLDRMGVPLQPHQRGLPRPPPLRRQPVQADPLRRRDHRAAAPLRPRRADPPLRGRGQGQQVRVLGVPRPIIADEGTDIDAARCVGIVAQDMRTMQIRSFRADAVVMATGRVRARLRQEHQLGHLHRRGRRRCYQAGAWYGNGEMIQVHPTAIPGADKCRLMSESARGEGGRVWVPRKAGRHPPGARSPRTNAGTSSKSATPTTATSSPATSRPARSSTSASTTAWASTARTRSTST